MAVVEVVGIVEVGGPRARSLPFDPRRVVRAHRGSSLTIRLLVARSDGAPYVTPGASVRVAVRKSPRFPHLVLGDAALNLLAGPNVWDFSLAPPALLAAEPGIYIWDARLTESGGTRHQIVPASAFAVEPTMQEVA